MAGHHVFEQEGYDFYGESDSDSQSDRPEAEMLEIGAINNERDLERLIGTLSERVRVLTEQMGEVRRDVGEMKRMADRYKGAFLFIVGIGGAAGWIFSIWDRITGH